MTTPQAAPASPARPAGDVAGTGTVTTADDIRREFYEEADWSRWIVELQLDPLVLIVSDDSTGALYRVPVLLDPAKPGEVTFGPDETVLVNYVTAPLQTAEAAKGGPRRRIAAAWASKQTSRPAGQNPAEVIIAAAVRRGALTQARARHYREAAASGKDITMVGRLWGAGRPIGTFTADAQDDEEENLWQSVYPDPEQAAAELERRTRLRSREAQRFAQSQDYSLAAAGDGGPLVPNDGSSGPGNMPVTHPATTTLHEHEHSDYGNPPAPHTHSHSHLNDASHQPGTSHQHQMASTDPVAAGIAARARTQAAAGDHTARDTDDALFERLFGS